MQILLHIVGKLEQNSLIAYQFYSQCAKEDKLNDVPNQSEDEPFSIINGLHDFIVVVHNSNF